MARTAIQRYRRAPANTPPGGDAEGRARWWAAQLQQTLEKCREEVNAERDRIGLTKLVQQKERLWEMLPKHRNGRTDWDRVEKETGSVYLQYLRCEDAINRLERASAQLKSIMSTYTSLRTSGDEVMRKCEELSTLLKAKQDTRKPRAAAASAAVAQVLAERSGVVIAEVRVKIDPTPASRPAPRPIRFEPPERALPRRPKWPLPRWR
jgi:hypothetical protein